MGRTAVAALWVASVAVVLFASGTQAAVAAGGVFWIMVVVHAIECVVFLPRLRRAGGSLGAHLVQTFLFGVLHLRSLAPERPRG